MAEKMYRDMRGRTYSSSQVEHVGGVTYVKGTSILVAPVSSDSSSSSGSSSSRTSSSSSRSSGSSSRSGGGGGSFTITDAEGRTVTVPLLTEEQVGTIKSYLQAGGDPTKIFSGPGQISEHVYSYLGSQRPQQPQQQQADVLRQQYESALADMRRQYESAMADVRRQYEDIIAGMRQQIEDMQKRAAQEAAARRIERVETKGVTPPEAREQKREERSELPVGTSGFVFPVGAAVAVSPEALYSEWKKVFGREDEGARQYLSSEQFRSVLQGNVPLWMYTDPLWRLFLQRVGVIPSASGRGRLLEAARRRLQGG